MKTTMTMMFVALMLAPLGCDSKAAPAEGEAGATAAIVKEEIPAELVAEVSKEITEENADDMAAKLEAEIAADDE